MRSDSTSSPPSKPGLHPRNRNKHPYDLPVLFRDYPELAAFRFRTRGGSESIDFSDPAAVRVLNTVLLKAYYGIRYWDLPPGYLCPPIPGRADHIHTIADLLASDNDGIIPTGTQYRILDIGTGASCIYPLLGSVEYGWSFTGSDVDEEAVRSAQRIIEGNSYPSDTISIRQQSSPDSFFSGIIQPGEVYHAAMCNPPFHSSMEQARSGTHRKWKNLGLPASRRTTLNFGGRAHELVYPGGETAFLRGMIGESRAFSAQVMWFTSLVSRSSSLPELRKHLSSTAPVEVRELPVFQGQKSARLLAWTFTLPGARAPIKKKITAE